MNNDATALGNDDGDYRVIVYYQNGGSRAFTYSHEVDARDFQRRVIRRPRNVRRVRLMQRPVGQWTEVEATELAPSRVAAGRGDRR